MAKDRMKIDDVLGDTKPPVTNFAEADKNVTEQQEKNKGGRPIKGKSEATYPIRFNVDKETYEWLMKQTVKTDGMPAKERTAHAVAKKILTAQYELSNP